MNDANCTQFLQWALPRLRMRWPGYRKVRKQVCKRIGRRMKELDLADVWAYRDYLESHPEEWPVLDDYCRITISRFYRDRGLFDVLGEEILPALIQAAKSRQSSRLRCWSAGCASGEEPYTLALLWRLRLRPAFPDVSLSLIATDADPHVLKRAREGLYSHGSLKDLPPSWREQGFERQGKFYRLREDYREPVEFRLQDLRREMPAGKFDLILCRNLAFTYFEESLQKEMLQKIVERLQPAGRLVIGQHEALPFRPPQLLDDRPNLGIFRRAETS